MEKNKTKETCDAAVKFGLPDLSLPTAFKILESELRWATRMFRPSGNSSSSTIFVQRWELRGARKCVEGRNPDLGEIHRAAEGNMESG